jgi:hypothetical protein
MYPMIPDEMMANAMQLICLVTTAFAALVSYAMTLRF